MTFWTVVAAVLTAYVILGLVGLLIKGIAKGIED